MRELLMGHPRDVAPLLLGATIQSRIDGQQVAIRLTEVEAYGGVGEDPGSHAYRRQTPRNATMFGPGGRAYVYFTYGMHWCLNVVTGPADVAGAVLLRGGEVIDGESVAMQRRGPKSTRRDLARGPARLSTALGVTGELDGVDLLLPRSPLRLVLAESPAAEVMSSARTGVAGAGAATPWRFYLADEPTVSPYRPAKERSARM